MAIILTALGVLLIGWGGLVLATGDYVATLDIAAGLVGTGVVVIALSAIVRAIDQLRRVMPVRWDHSPAVSVPEPAPAPARVERPSAPVPAIVEAPSVEPKSALHGEERQTTREAVPPVVSPTLTERLLPAAHADDQEDDAPVASDVVEAEVQTGPSLIREGAIDGMTFRFFSDGSIEADYPDGTRRYASMADAREEILQARERAQQSAVTPARPDSTTLRANRDDHENAGADDENERDEVGPAKAAPEPAADQTPRVSWDGYLAGGRAAGSRDERPAPAASRPFAATPMPSTDAPQQAPAVPPQERRDFPTAPARPLTPRPPEPNWSESFRQLLKKENQESEGDGSGEVQKP